MRSEAELPDAGKPDRLARAHVAVVVMLLSIMGVELVLLVLGQRWLHAALVVAIMVTMCAPIIARSKLPVDLPSEIQVLGILFIFATLFLGEVQDYYKRFWWWDLAIHGTAGLMLGLLGFLITYLLNQNELVHFSMRPAFVALFAFFFSVSIGTIWEIFEFGMDQVFGLNMQKPMLGDPSGLTDTMWDLIVDTVGAAAVSIIGWLYMRRTRRPYIDNLARRFLERNPSWFRSN